MKLKFTFWILILLSLTTYGQNVGIGTSSPNALLDVSATNNGVLIPRVALTGTGSASPLTSPTTSTLVYNTATVSNVTPGFYYWNGSAWVRVIDNSSLSGATTVSNTSGTNTLSTTVNGVTGTGVNIINSNALSMSGNNLTATINGIGSSAQSLSGLSLSGDVTGTLAGSTVGKIQGTPVTISSLANGNLLQYNSAGTDWVNVAPGSALFTAGTGLSWSGSTLNSTGVTSIVAGSGVSISGGTGAVTITNSAQPAVNTITGSGTTNYHAKFTGANTIGNSQIYDDGTLVGIGGTGQTAVKLSVVAASNGFSASFSGGNAAGIYPALNQGFSHSENFSGGMAEEDVWNTLNPSTFTSTGFRFLQLLTASSARDLMFLSNTGNVGIGTTSPAAALDITSTTSGFLPPRLATNPVTPAQGMVYYNTTTNCLMMNNGTSWQSVSCCSPGITGQPASSPIVCSGNGTASFSVTATGAGLTYQWQEYISSWNNISNGGVYSGATTSTLTITNPPSSMNARQYRCVVSGTCSPSATSNAASLSVHTSSVPITLTNVQSSATPTNYQQMLTINSSAYAAYESSGLQNVEFSTGPAGTGTVLQAWIESGATSASTSTVYWVNLGSNTIAASGGTLTIYMDFMPATVMSATGPTGVAPQLFGGGYYAASYAQFDNGANVFTNYWNFAGTSSAGWTTCGPQEAPTFNNGLTMSNTAGNQGGVYSTATISSGMAIDGLLSSTGGSVGIGGETSIVFTEDLQEGPWGIGTMSGCVITSWAGSSGAPAANTQYVVTGYYITGGSKLLVNYSGAGYPSAATAFGSPINIYVHSYHANTGALVQWLRTRAYPPGATMPGVGMGSVGCY
jgi:hypothetical protein